MATKIRLQRHGKKHRAFFHIVVADSRSKRDGRYIERLGVYNPNTNPATIELNFDSTLEWIKTGAEPTHTARSILSYKGVMMKSHLDKGVLKGALTQKQADAKFEKWLSEKEAKIEAKRTGIAKTNEEASNKALAAEKEANDKRLAEIQAKEAAALAAALPEEEVAEESEAPEASAEEAAPAAEAVVEAPVEEKKEAPAAEATEEAPEAKTEEAPVAEAKEEAAPEAKSEEAPAEEKEEEKKD